MLAVDVVDGPHYLDDQPSLPHRQVVAAAAAARLFVLDDA